LRTANSRSLPTRNRKAETWWKPVIASEDKTGREAAVLDRADDWLAWLDLTRPEAELLRPLATRSLIVDEVR
jgi:hypothetical protein